MLLLSLVLGCAPPTPVEVATSPEPTVSFEAPVDTGSTKSPYDHSLLVPSLSQRESDFDLELLGTRVKRFDIRADLAVLGALDAEENEAVRRHLSADPRWRVGVWEGALVA